MLQTIFNDALFVQSFSNAENNLCVKMLYHCFFVAIGKAIYISLVVKFFIDVNSALSAAEFPFTTVYV